MTIATVGEKFAHDLADIYDAEHHFLDAQQKMYNRATNDKLKSMLADHISETRQQIDNLQQIFAEIGVEPIRATCQAALGLVKEGEQMMAEASNSPYFMDCVIASAASQVEHYEVASYRNLLTTAQQIDHSPLQSLLQKNLSQEEETGQKLEHSYSDLLKIAMDTQKIGYNAS